MATVMLLRTFSKGSRNVLLQMQPLSRCANNIVSKEFTGSPALASFVDHFRARRGPFTPEEKKGKGHLMDASTHWKLERFVAISLCGVMPTALFFQGAPMDHLLTTFVFLHGYWGVNVVIEDYLVKFVPWVKKLWYLVAIVGFAGLINFNYNDVGIEYWKINYEFVQWYDPMFQQIFVEDECL